MPPQFLFDLAQFDLGRDQHGKEKIRAVNPQRGAMEHLDGVIHIDREIALAYKDVRPDEFWVPGHIPGRPLLPGVIMLEAAAQLASFFTRVSVGWDGFVGFGGVDEVKFRREVPPGKRLYVLVRMTRERRNIVFCDSQGIVDGELAFEAKITGVRMGELPTG